VKKRVRRMWSGGCRGCGWVGRSLYTVATHRLARTFAAVIILGYPYRYLNVHSGEDLALKIDQAVVWYLVIALAVAMFGLLISVVDWRAKNCGLLTMLFALEVNFSVSLWASYGGEIPYPYWTNGIVRAGLVVASTLLIVAVFVYVNDGRKLPPPWNSIRYRRAARRAQLRGLKDSLTILGLDDIH